MSTGIAPDDVLREAWVMHALRDSARVPRILAVGDDSSIIGAPFYVMEKVEGRVVTSEIPPALDTPAQRRRMGEERAVGRHARRGVPAP